MPNPENLNPPWIPGQSGNPTGSSAGRRRATRLRQAFDDLLAVPIPEDIELDLPEGVELPEGTTFAELIALRVIMVAARTPKVGDILAAAAMVLASTAKPDMALPPAVWKTPILPATEERRLAIAEQLGLSKQGQ